MMGTPRLTLKERAEIVKLFLPDHTLDATGKVVQAPSCSLCGQAVDWTTAHNIMVNEEWVMVHEICPDRTEGVRR